jgi:hypothetical protein
VPRFMKKPIVVEAEQWFPGKRVVGVWGDEGQEMCPCFRVGGAHNHPHVMTAHDQIIRLEPGDWIIPEPDGRGHYPCKPDIFAATYEPVPCGSLTIQSPGG